MVCFLHTGKTWLHSLEAVMLWIDVTGVHPITKQYWSEWGYTFSPLPPQTELRASYFFCHTDNKVHLWTTSALFALASPTASLKPALPLPWSPSEVTCEENCMVVWWSFFCGWGSCLVLYMTIVIVLGMTMFFSRCLRGAGSCPATCGANK